MKKFLFFCAFVANLASASAYSFSDGKLSLPVDSGVVCLEWFASDIVRVVKSPLSVVPPLTSLSIVASPSAPNLKVKEVEDTIVMSSKALVAKVCRTDGVVSFSLPSGGELLSERGAARFSPFDDAGRACFSPSQSFCLEPDEAIYGLGILQNGKLSQRGENRDIIPGNTEDGIPFVQSIKGYGVYWDNYSSTRFSDVDNVMSFASVTGDAVDYYFMYGGSADGVVAKVRGLSGDVPMAPLWAYGFFQSKERYKSQEETLDVLRRYRKDGVPIDCMIQDWQYWGNNYLWNAMDFLNENFPDPKAMVDEIHDNNAHCMISIWSSFGPMTKPYRQLQERGLLFDMDTWPQSGISHVWPPRMDYPSGVKVYDCYSAEARDIYWDNLLRLYKLGLDGWWMDSTEPDHFDWKEEDFDHPTALGSYRSVRLAFPLMTVGGVFDHQRAASDSARVFILTRSGSFGQQRYGANVWSGDVVSTWDMLRRQIPAGLNFSLTGNPNFNTDLGGFFAGSYNRAWKGKPAYENPAYHELYVRWTQQGVFTPMMRSHGADVPREFFYYGKAGEPVYDALVDAVKLRYRLLPYIYSTAHGVSARRGSFMRALVMDFAADSTVWDMPDEYMFGECLLATPVLKANYTPEVLRRDADANAGWDKNTGRTSLSNLDNVDFSVKHPHSVYLPKGSDWYYFSSGERFEGGQYVSVDVCLSDIPFFVKAGSVVPMGPDVQWSTEKPWDALELRVYPGADGAFVLYEDEFDGYNYEKGAFTEIPFKWIDKSSSLVIGDRVGAFPGMLERRVFNIVLPDGRCRSVEYAGKRVAVKF